MIEKLQFETTETVYEGKNLTVKTHTSPYDMQVKINELVDTVNQLVLCEQARTCYELIHKNETPADPYAEQRKWIGKLCRFWDMETDKGTYGILTDIKDDRYVCPNGMFMCNRIRYQHCEPVKPDDDIIYKGK